MCPQKWKASASPGLTSPPTVRAPARANTAPLTRARKPRREESGTGRAAPLGGGEDRLELPRGVEGALGQDGAVGVEGDGERAAGGFGQRPRVGVADLVEGAHHDPRVALERAHGWCERLA